MSQPDQIPDDQIDWQADAKAMRTVDRSEECRLRARIAALEAGLKPFAEEACAIWCQRNGCNHGDEQACRYCAAHSLLAEAQP